MEIVETLADQIAHSGTLHGLARDQSHPLHVVAREVEILHALPESAALAGIAVRQADAEFVRLDHLARPLCVRHHVYVPAATVNRRDQRIGCSRGLEIKQPTLVRDRHCFERLHGRFVLFHPLMRLKRSSPYLTVMRSPCLAVIAATISVATAGRGSEVARKNRGTRILRDGVACPCWK